ncbi:LsmAD domain-containing protein [Phlyctema vagabunda]|uniref:LsmAD domain-containing protein n=1 Tax=Phlyctema vagabunda TaxID=108571 RepID=A0ABR4PRB5_9HELO
MVTSKKPSDQTNTNGSAKYREQPSNMSYQRAGNKNDARAQNGNTPSFRTDAAISGNRLTGGRELKKWVPDAPEDADMSLESGRSQAAGGKAWDQFAENERRFGVKTDYDENIYTTTIDKSHPLYRQRLAEADKKAREIERSVATNSHVAEERITDNLKAGSNGLDEEDKYSGVIRQNKQDFPPLSSSNNKYTPPARRAPAGNSNNTGAPVDPAIISSQLSRPDKPATEKPKTTTKPASTEPAVTTAPPPAPQPAAAPGPVAPGPTPKPTAEAKPTAVKPVPSNVPGITNRTASPKNGVPNATATVERDVASAFKGFAAQQRRTVEHVRQTKARNDKEVKLNDLKKFADTFKLLTPVPADLVSIIAKDPAKQKEIQEKAKRNSEEAKANPSETAKPVMPLPEPKAVQRAVPANSSSSPSGGAAGRQNAGRGNGYAHQTQYNSNSYRNDRSNQGQQIQAQQGPGQLSARLRNGVQAKHSQQPLNPIPSRADQHVPTGPSEPSFTRRSSGVSSAQSARLNPNSHEFRPNAFAAVFNPTGTPSVTSSPRSTANTITEARQTPPARTLEKRKPLAAEKRPVLKGKFDSLEHIRTFKPPPGANWEKTAGIKPAFSTPPTWKQPKDNEDPKSAIMETYKSIFEKSPFPAQQPISPIHASHAVPQQVPHQHQLPFHLQHQNMHPRQSPRQPPNHMHSNHGPNPSFNGPDDHHRMMPSHSAQSYASPRLQNVPMAYPSPMPQPAQMFNGQILPYPPPHQMTRQASQGQQFMPQPGHIAPGFMMPQPGNGMMGPQGMGPAPQMMYPPGQHFMPPGGGPPGMPVNGYPSPGRTAPLMISQGSQQGHQQQMYGMSPGQQYGAMVPLYPQQQPGQMPGRGYGPPHFGTSPQQMHQYNGGQQHRNHQNGNFNNNKNYQQNAQHANSSPNNQAPAGPPSRPSETTEETK